MPMFQFRCDCGNEFEKIIPAKQELYKWCNYCNKLTVWEVILETHAMHYKEKVCSACLGNQHIPPERTPNNVEVEERVALCPACGRDAKHVMSIKVTGSHSGGPNNLDHSVRFHFDYNEPS